jgi:hypothetical protein
VESRGQPHAAGPRPRRAAYGVAKEACLKEEEAEWIGLSKYW